MTIFDNYIINSIFEIGQTLISPYVIIPSLLGILMLSLFTGKSFSSIISSIFKVIGAICLLIIVLCVFIIQKIIKIYESCSKYIDMISEIILIISLSITFIKFVFSI